MEITEIKQRLSLATVLQYYGLKPDKNLRLHCPFHDDKTPSLQVYYKTHTCYCFSSNCKTAGKAIDVIDFVMYKENLTKHEALKKCASLLGGTASPPPNIHSREVFLQKMFTYFCNAVHNSAPAQSYIEQRSLNYKQIDIGYNGGQFHHGARKDETLIAQCLEYGLLLDKNLVSKTGDKAYNVFGKGCIVFPLKNKANQIVSLYFRSIVNETDSKHFYLKDRQGLYPGYPLPETKTLILTEAIIDAATLLQASSFGRELEGACILACYGTNGLTDEHLQAIQSLKKLEEIIFAFDNDEAGKSATAKYATQLHAWNNKLRITTLELPCKDVNETLQAHTPEIFQHLMNERKEITFSFSFEKSDEKENLPEPAPTKAPAANQINTSSNKQELFGQPHNLTYRGTVAIYAAKGVLKNPADSLKIALQIQHLDNANDYRSKVDLYEYKQLQQVAATAAGRLQLDAPQVEHDLMTFTRLLEHYKENYREQKKESAKIVIPEATLRECIAFLKAPELLHRLNERIGQSGLVGEENNRLFLFLIAISYKMSFTLHALIQGSSGSGKTRLMQTVSRLMPGEDTKHFTRVTDNSFYNYGEHDLSNKLLCFEDIDGLKEDALLALRELQSNDILISSTSSKDDNGTIRSIERTVRGPIASLSATTRGDYYEDNISRSFVVAVDESHEQTQRIIDYQNKKAAGLINTQQETQTREFIQHCVRLLKPLEVVNPYAHKIQLPAQAHKIRRLNEMYQHIIKQIVILHQYQRPQDKQGRLIAQKEDLRHACEILFESILLKVDELEGNLRHFFEKIKAFMAQKAKAGARGESATDFNRFEIREATGLRKTQQHAYINKLVELEYLQQYGFANRGFTYRIAHHDNIDTLRRQIKQQLQQQLEVL